MNTIKLVTNFSSITSKFTQFGRRRVESASCTVEPLFADFSWKNTVWLIKFTCRKNLSSIYTKLIYIRLLVKLATELFFGEYVLLTNRCTISSPLLWYYGITQISRYVDDIIKKLNSPWDYAQKNSWIWS